MRKIILVTAICVGAALPAFPASADTVLSTDYKLSLSQSLTTEQQFTPGSLGDFGMLATGGPGPDGPSVSVSGSGDTTQPGNPTSFNASAIVSWDLQVIGPTDNTDLVSIPVMITGAYTLSASGLGLASAGVGIGGAAGYAGGYGNIDVFSCDSTGGCGTASFTTNTSLDYRVDLADIYSVVISAGGGIGFNGAGSFSSYVDPQISIDNTSGKYSDYSLLISPDALPFSATPLPATLPLFISGLGALGALGWRRKRKAVAVPAA